MNATQAPSLTARGGPGCLVPGKTKRGSDMALSSAVDRAEVSTNAVALRLASDMREELLTIVREMLEQNTVAGRLAYSRTRPQNCWASPENSSTICCAPASSGQSRQGGAV